jgi:ubiquitin-activating enzyme E1
MDLYSRQLYALGKDSLISMKNAKVLIIGSSTPFVEIMKNLVLMGIGEITIADNRLIQESDLENNYYVNSDDLNKDFVNIVGFRMQKLNPTVRINKYSKNEFSNDFLKSFSIIVILNCDYILSQKLHELNIPHVVTRTANFSGYIFVDFIEFTSYNPNGEKIKQGLILNICKDNNNIQIETVENHDLFVGNCIKIKNDEFKIVQVISPKKFVIDKNIINELIQLEKYEEIKIPKKIHFKSIDNIKYKIDNYLDSENGQGHVFINSIIGGILSQNIINYINKSGTPINQFISYDFSEFKILLDGKKFNEKVTDKNIFIVGAGALGCEHIKNLAYLGVKNIIITDYDKIEKSNLSRQFLFRNKDIGKFKSNRVKKAILKMRSDINIEALTLKVEKETETKFNEKFFNSIDCVFNALDNIEARKYVDSKCIDYDLPLFESGTLGTKANSQTIIPYLTESYSNSVNDDTSSIPLCTIKSFPYLPEHSVAWAKELFAELFSQTIEIVNNLDFEQIYQDKIIADIKNLITKYPEDCEEEQIRFWSGTRKFPLLSNLDGTTLEKEFYSLGNLIKNRIQKNNMIENFDKDSSELLHVEFLTVITNIRNRIYSIELVDEFTVKGISGKIIPALCTTTSVISGFVIIEFLRYCINCDKNYNIDGYSNNYINLSTNLFISSSPIKDTNNEWRKVNLTNLTLEEILIKIQNEYDDYISSIYVNDKLVYSADIEYDISYLNSKLNNLNEKVYGYIILDNDSNDIIRFYL